MGKLFYIMGKSAAGKDRIYKALLEENKFGFSRLVLYTTRPIRAGEEDGREYHFVNDAGLESFRKTGRVIEERTYQTIAGPWTYATVDDGRLYNENETFLGIGTLESYNRMRAYFAAGEARLKEAPEAGSKAVPELIPIFIEVDDRIRLERSIERESKQAEPNYQEVCRRFLADSEDFSEKNMAEAGITRRFRNDGTFEECLTEVEEFIASMVS